MGPGSIHLEQVSIYVLIDPRSGFIRYVGKSTQPYKRLSNHCCLGRLDTSHKANWIRSLLRCGLRPRLKNLESVQENKANERERFWISKLKADGVNLVNETDGGDGVTLTAEIRAKMSIGIGNYFRGKPKSPEHRAKLAAVLVKSRPSPVQIAEYNRSRKGKPPSQATLAAVARARAKMERGPDGRWRRRSTQI